ncbi:GAF domain-containing protein [Geobacter pelophilus]|uniref:histidine kinase n=1 Tax=Geoanaerobacter pelophilus TaxID=60036 RepID=A0AAW4L6M8_9BACT|nr:ATP-binding protein [Geoanaerobacter pelophilus]MBT0664240.1 GAF domain-containing protein [Geoanaerobacter pelophilus]
MSPKRMDQLSQLLCTGIGLLFGLVLSIELGAWERAEVIFWPAVILITSFLLVQQLMLKNGRAELERKEADALERLVDMKREVDKTARRYKCLLEGAGNAVFVFDARTNQLQEVNRKGTELFGYSKEEMLALTGKDLTPTSERRRFSDLVRRVKRRGRGRVESLTFRGKNDEEFLGEVEARLIDLDDEEVVHVTVRDITFKSRAEKEIKQRNRELSILNSIIAKANLSLQMDKVLDVILTETMEAFGAEAGMIHLLDGVTNKMPLAIQRNLADEMVQLIEQCVCPTQERHCCHSLPAAHQRPCQVVLAAGDHGWQSLAGVPLFANQKAVGILHIFSETVRSCSQEDIRFLNTVGNQIGMVIEHARVFAELSWKTEELLRSYTLLEKNSHQLALSQKRLKMNLALVERANKDLERLDRMKTHFLGIVSHEFKTPLTSIIGGTQFLMASNGVWSPEEERLIAIIHEGGTRLNDIVTNLLKVARLESKSFSLSKAPINLEDMLKELNEHFVPVLGERGQRLTMGHIEAIPSFFADREYLEEVFSQLLENAIKFSSDGGDIFISAHIVDRSLLEAKREVLSQFNAAFLENAGTASFILVEIRDSGIGINKDDHLHIFDKFYGAGDIRHHSSGKTKFQGKGPGLGLSIVKGMIEAHGGMVWVESPHQDPDKSPGSSFFVLLPTEEAELQPVLPFMHGSDDSGQTEETHPPLLN